MAGFGLGPLSLALQGYQTAAGYNAARGQANAAIAQGNYAKTAYTRDAGFADAQAADAIARGDQAAGQQVGATRQAVGNARAAAGAGGVDVNTGSANDVQEGIQRVGALDAAQIRTNAARDAWGYQVQASDYRNQGNMAAAAGENTAAGIRRQAFGTLLTGIGKGFESVQDARNNQVPSGGGLRVPAASYRTSGDSLNGAYG